MNNGVIIYNHSLVEVLEIEANWHLLKESQLFSRSSPPPVWKQYYMKGVDHPVRYTFKDAVVCLERVVWLFIRGMHSLLSQQRCATSYVMLFLLR